MFKFSVQFTLVILPIIFFLLQGSLCLETDLTKFSEGGCNASTLTPVIANRETIDSFHYLLGGSKLIMYEISRRLPNYADLREDEFYYDACYWRNVTTIRDSVSAIFGYGQLLVIGNLKGNPEGVYLDAVGANANDMFSEKTIITLTDHKTFAVGISCLQPDDIRNWVLVTKTDYVDPATIKIVEDHVASLGFKRENFVFLRYDSCRKGQPFSLW